MRAILIGLCALALSGCGAAVGLATMAAVNQAGKSGANQAAKIEQMNCTELRAEYERTKGISINPVTSASHATTIDVMRAKRCRFPG